MRAFQGRCVLRGGLRSQLPGGLPRVPSGAGPGACARRAPRAGDEVVD